MSSITPDHHVAEPAAPCLDRIARDENTSSCLAGFSEQLALPETPTQNRFSEWLVKQAEANLSDSCNVLDTARVHLSFANCKQTQTEPSDLTTEVRAIPKNALVRDEQTDQF